MRRLIASFAAFWLLLAAAPALVQAQEGESLLETLARAAALDEQSRRSGLIAFVENQLSTPDRQIRLTGIEGALSSNASIGQITISDSQGIWLLIENARINWNQGALIFGRLEVNELAADRIVYARNPISTEEAPAVPAPEAGGFQVPQFPVAVRIQSLSVPLVAFGEGVFGLGSEIALEGGFVLEGGNLDANLDIERLDGPGGTLDLDLAYSNQTQEIDLSLVLSEPENGILANLLNIEGRPEIVLALQGAGPITDLSTELTLDADGSRVLSGTATLGQTGEGLAIDARLGGPIATLIPEIYRDFFGPETALTVSAHLHEEGGISVSELDLSGGELTLTASGHTASDGFLRRLVLDAAIAPAGGSTVLLPVPGAATTVESARLQIDYGAEDSSDWFGNLALVGFSTPGFSARALGLDATGVAANLDDPATRRLTLNADGTLSGIETESEEIAQALGSSIGLGIAALWEAGAPIELAQLRVLGEALGFEMAGAIEDGVFTGDLSLDSSSLAPFSGLAGRDLSGAVSLDAGGTISPLIGGFDLTLDGTATDLSVDDALADRLLEGDVTLAGRVARTEAGLEAEGFRIANPNLELTADGVYATGAADFAFDLALADLALLVDDAVGRVTASGSIRGSEGVLDLEAGVAVLDGRVAGRPLRDARLDFSGVTRDAGLTGAFTGSGLLDGVQLALSADLDANAERVVLSDLAFDTRGASLAGDLTRTAAGLLEGRLVLDADDIETMAALLLLEGSGAADAEIVLSHDGQEQAARVRAAISNLSVAEIRVDAARLEAAIEDLFGVPGIEGQVEGTGIAAAGVTAETLSLTARQTGDTTDFSGAARLAGNTNIDLAGSLAPLEGGYRVALDRFTLAQNALSARLAAPTALVVSGDTVRFDGVRLDVGSGRIVATGTAGQTLDIAVEIASLPLDIANTISPGLGLGGTISGTATVTGSASDPRASFSLQGTGLNAAAIAEFGIAPLSLSIQGGFANNVVTLSPATVSGSGGLSARAQGRIPLSGSGLVLDVTGSAPLSLANRFLVDRGSQASGTATLTARATGSLENPQFSGTVSVAGAEFIDPELNLRLQGITGSAALSGNQVTIQSLTARLATGGSVSVSGSVGLDAPAFTSNLAIALNGARYADGTLVVAVLDGNLAVTGPLSGGALVAGNVFISRADITVPETFAGGATLIDVTHVRPPPAVAATLARARADARSRGAAPAAPFRLDVTITAPNQIFIRGRGLDAEVGGAVRITGPVDAVQPVGGLELIRGRLTILGRRIEFEAGSVTLTGDLDPFVDLRGRIAGRDITVFVTVTGQVSEPTIAFSSDPMLPQDEVLSRLLFDRGIGELSPIQLAQLAAAAAELAGAGGGPGILENLRRATGFDDLDIISDDQGNVAVRAGRYIQENVYLGVEAGGAGQGRVTIDLDITDTLRARGATSTDGNSSIGIFYEQDY